MEICIISGWDKTLETLENNPQVVAFAEKLGFTLPVLHDLLTLPFPPDLKIHKELGEDVGNETLNINDKPLERLLVTLHPAAAKMVLAEMTQFKSGGETIFNIGESEAELTYATEVTEQGIPRDSLKKVKIKPGDLVISTTTPNNWTEIPETGFKMIYFVGNPDGPHIYKEVPKTKIPVI